MRIAKRIIAAAMCAAVLAGSLIGCHKKGATVAELKSGDKTYSVSSGVYMMALIVADSEGRSKVNEQLKSDSKSTSDVDYAKQTIDKTPFYDWVNDRADTLINEYLYIDSEYNKAKLSMTDDETKKMETYLSYQWSLSYQYICEPNGVSKDSYLQYQKVAVYERNALFKSIYGEGGSKEVDNETVLKSLTDNFVIANTIKVSTVDKSSKALPDEEIEKYKTQLQGYADRLNKGESFDTIYVEYNGKDDSKDSSDTADDETAKPLDKRATLYGSDKTNSSSDNFSDVSGAEVGNATVVSGENYLLLVNRKDILADPYYVDNYSDEALYILKNDEFSDDVTAAAKKLDIKRSSYERNYLKPKKIDYSTYQNYYQSLQSRYANQAAGTASAD